MSSLHILESSTAPTFTAASASASLFGLDSLDTTMLDEHEWYHSPTDNAFPPLSPGHEHYGPNYEPNFASHAVPVSLGGVHRPSYPHIQPMNGLSHPHDNGAQHPVRFDEFGAISPLQTTYAPPYTTPYPDSTSSAQSEDPIAVEADEDKRKRNQAASARFRQKKKQREQQMMEQSREMVDKTKKLENEVEGLKRENTFLKRLLVEKVDNMSDDDRAALGNMASPDKKKGKD
ncbi:hypothetical protein EJ04DRAFT_567823 [Polyplosphaeria fusca]|uniref:BZIP domain-containing protein n=1 Tax=Polyplosphaeria fusca TaxID=682080 RepID=A0A9P4QMW6_9PLEO|nr:hypothetical protein EJ04DRAFT_567823 [Polyplosphaeria fusca]